MPITRREILLSTGALAGSSLSTGAAQEAYPPLQDTVAIPESVSQALSIWDLKAMAREKMPASTWGYLTGGAGDENTVRWNREGYEKLRLRAAALVDVSRLDTRIRLFGQQLSMPILIGATGGHMSSHPEGEKATARAAGEQRTVLTVSTVSSYPIEEIAREATGPLWFQLYVLRDRVFTRDLVQRAEDAGCKALCITVDSATTGPRNRQTRTARLGGRAGGKLPHLEGYRPPGPVENDIFSITRAPDLTWKDVEQIRANTKMPVLLKGILTASDAARAVREGVEGIIVSNHGGRNLDTAQATIGALPEIVEAVDGAFPVLIDGGIRRGTDVLKALALGADAVLIGRAYRYGLSAAGAEGVSQALQILRKELEMAMASTGRTRIADIDRSVLWDG